MNKKIVGLLSVAGLLATPVISLAAIPNIPSGNPIMPVQILDAAFMFIWPIVVGVIIIMFIVAGFEFLTAQGDPSKVARARQAVIWGVVGVFVILLAFSIIFIVQNAFNLG